jgi:hypothetical protein
MVLDRTAEDRRSRARPQRRSDIGYDVMARAKGLVNRERADRSRSSRDDDLRRPSPFEKPSPSGVTMRDDRRTLPEQRWAIY